MRLIDQNDVQFIIHCLLRLACESHVYGSVQQDQAYVAEWLGTGIREGYLRGAIEPSAGFILYMLGPEWYTPELHAHEMLLYVVPEKRGGTLAVRLIREFERTAVLAGAVELRAGATTAVNDTRTLELYERLGYERLGTGVRKRI